MSMGVRLLFVLIQKSSGPWHQLKVIQYKLRKRKRNKSSISKKKFKNVKKSKFIFLKNFSNTTRILKNKNGTERILKTKRK
ncbi:unnamed protein product [Meloidogyne enterolobii]|uniref:Uncharacterized protein n=1 Tax=Meloidogyne enterolobii TaxID=390850 RepID=A0ACB0ZC11_MELEN